MSHYGGGLIFLLEIPIIDWFRFDKKMSDPEDFSHSTSLTLVQ
jgi:hypothetical protein